MLEDFVDTPVEKNYKISSITKYLLNLNPNPFKNSYKKYFKQKRTGLYFYFHKNSISFRDFFLLKSKKLCFYAAFFHASEHPTEINISKSLFNFLIFKICWKYFFSFFYNIEIMKLWKKVAKLISSFLLNKFCVL